MAANKFEVGMTYSRFGTYYLAVGPRMLLTREGTKFRAFVPHTRYRPQRSLTVGELCEIWGCDSAELDQISRKYFALAHCQDMEPADSKASVSLAPRSNTYRVSMRRAG